MPGEIINNVENSIIHYLKDFWPMLLSLIAFVVSILVVVKGKIPLIEKRIDDIFDKLKRIDDSKFIERNMLFDSNNEYRFPTMPMCISIREECHMQQKVFQDVFCKKLENITVDLKEIVHDSNEKREELREEISDVSKQLIELVTQMRTILARDRKEETVDMVRMVVHQVMNQIRINNTMRE